VLYYYVISCALPFFAEKDFGVDDHIGLCCEDSHFRLPCFTFRKRERKGTVERIDLKIKIDETCFRLLSSDFVRHSRKLIVVFRRIAKLWTFVWMRRSTRNHPFLLSSERERFFSVISSRGSVTTIRSRAADNGREPSENFIRTMSSWVYHSVGYELAIVYHLTDRHFSSFHLEGWWFLTSFIDCSAPSRIELIFRK